MKKGTGRLLALLMIGCIAMSGCTAAKEQENKNTETETEDSKDAAEETQTDASSDVQAETAASSLETENPDVSASTASSPSDVVPASSQATDDEIHSFVGIITDATKYSVSAQSSLGNIYSLTIPESGVQGNLKYLTIGQIATITYTGSLDEEHASLVGLSDSFLITGIYVEEYAFAIKIINAVKNMDKDALISLTNIPIFLDTGEFKGAVDDVNTLKNMDSETLFTEALVERMGNYNLFDLEYTGAGFVMGDGGPNITFDVDDDGILGIIGITSVGTVQQ